MADKPVGQLLRQFAVPSIIAMLVSSLYNIIDQLFIGRALVFLAMLHEYCFSADTHLRCLQPDVWYRRCRPFITADGGRTKKRSRCLYGQRTTDACFLRYCTLYHCPTFLTPMLLLFGATDQVLDYARTYTGITSLGFPFLILATGGGHLIRATAVRSSP